jgi:hypothetical protein
VCKKRLRIVLYLALLSARGVGTLSHEERERESVRERERERKRDNNISTTMSSGRILVRQETVRGCEINCSNGLQKAYSKKRVKEEEES